MAFQVDCPSCGSSVKVRRGGVEVTCRYCGSSIDVTMQTASVTGMGNSYRKIALAASAVFVFLVIGINVLVFYPAAEEDAKSVAFDTRASAVNDCIVMEFGRAGASRERLIDPRYIAVDRQGTIYVADADNGLVKVFDCDGNPQEAWSYTGNRGNTLTGMSASGDGLLYMVYSSQLYVHNGETGELLDSLMHPDGSFFADVDTAPDGSILASWYFNRDDIIRFTADGEVDVLVRGAVSEQTGEGEFDIMVTAGSNGEMYAYGGFNKAVLAFNAQGIYQFMLNSGDMLTLASGMDVDSRGRIWISDFGVFLVFGSDGEFINTVNPGYCVYDFVINDDMQLFGITMNDTVIQVDLSAYPV
ncbi:MAG: hypothetical protein KAR40_10395 [Candidatus Sabulitectum sp.]|nr:hypothetical protein [Candidatus Sabulitectum sp.]